jgi:hypothetical protein
MKKYYVLKLVAPRPTFAQDMSAEERATMQKHVIYWTDLMNKGFVLAFGPVIDPKGVYGLGIIGADSQKQVGEFIANDPANGLNKYEFYPMMAIVPGK